VTWDADRNYMVGEGLPELGSEGYGQAGYVQDCRRPADCRSRSCMMSLAANLCVGMGRARLLSFSGGCFDSYLRHLVSRGFQQVKKRNRHGLRTTDTLPVPLRLMGCRQGNSETCRGEGVPAGCRREACPPGGGIAGVTLLECDTTSGRLFMPN